MKSKSLTMPRLWALLLICGISSLVQVQAQRTSTPSPSTTYRSSDGRGTRITTASPNSTDTGNGTTDYSNIVVHNITQIQVLDENYLKVFLFPTENLLEIECHLNLSKWKQTPAGRSSSSGDSDKLMLRLCFERVEEDSLIDIISVGLDGENVAENSRGSGNLKVNLRKLYLHSIHVIFCLTSS
jgi:hypothetical protein